MALCDMALRDMAWLFGALRIIIALWGAAGDGRPFKQDAMNALCVVAFFCAALIVFQFAEHCFIVAAPAPPPSSSGAAMAAAMALSRNALIG
jgi:hypothetical protein